MVTVRNLLSKGIIKACFVSGLLGSMFTGHAHAGADFFTSTDSPSETFFANRSNTDGIPVADLNNGDIRFRFTLRNAGPVELTLRGYDIDTGTEVKVEGDNFSAFLKRGVNNGFSDVERIKLGNLTPGTHSYTISNNRRSTWRWGVTDIEILTDIDTSGAVYAVGDVGPGEGVVFHVDSRGTSGLEAAPRNLTRSVLCSRNIDIEAIWNSEPEFDPRPSGRINTLLIREYCGVSSAAGTALSYVWPGGQMDGYLPNAQEALLLHANRSNIGGFARDAYWTSSETNNSLALAIFGRNRNFGLDFYSKANKGAVRPIRAFYGN